MGRAQLLIFRLSTQFLIVYLHPPTLPTHTVLSWSSNFKPPSMVCIANLGFFSVLALIVLDCVTSETVATYQGELS